MAIAPQTTATTKTPTTCSCGSGLRPDRCCTLDWTQPSAPQGDIPNVTLAQTAFNNGKTAEAEQFAVDLLERFPLHLGALDLPANRPQIGEYHYRKVLELSGKRDGILLANLAW